MVIRARRDCAAVRKLTDEQAVRRTRAQMARPRPVLPKSHGPPTLPQEGATADEIGQTLAALLDWIVKARLADLLDAGLTHADVLKLVRAADDSRKGEFGPETLATIHDLAPKMDRMSFPTSGRPASR